MILVPAACGLTYVPCRRRPPPPPVGFLFRAIVLCAGAHHPPVHTVAATAGPSLRPPADFTGIGGVQDGFAPVGVVGAQGPEGPQVPLPVAHLSAARRPSEPDAAPPGPSVGGMGSGGRDGDPCEGYGKGRGGRDGDPCEGGSPAGPVAWSRLPTAGSGPLILGQGKEGAGPDPHSRGGAAGRQHGEYVSAPGKVFPRFGVAPRVGVRDSHSSVWPLEWSVTHKRGIL